jgi:hypothetical protein
LQAWYERHWKDAQDITPEVLRVIERHTREYTPFEVYVKALHEFCRGHELTAGEWELAGPDYGGSHLYPMLDRYQQEGYQALMQVARRYGGAFLCDGVGLGKTFVGLMLIERLVMHEGKRVALFVPKTAAEDVWKPALRTYLPHVGGVSAGDFSSLVVFNHINHYQRIVVALQETICLMDEIDEVINQYGGWPDTFLMEPVQREETEATDPSA